MKYSAGGCGLKIDLTNVRICMFSYKILKLVKFALLFSKNIFWSLNKSEIWFRKKLNFYYLLK